MDAGNNPSVQISIKFLSGPLAGKTVQINKPIMTIGRSPNNDIVVRDDPRVSRQHARLVWNDGSWSIEKHPQAASGPFGRYDYRPRGGHLLRFSRPDRNTSPTTQGIRDITCAASRCT